MAKNTSFDFSFIPNSRTARHTSSTSTTTGSTSNSSLSQEQEDRLLNLKRRFEDAIKIMIATWGGTQNEDNDHDDDENDTGATVFTQSTTVHDKAEERMVHHDSRFAYWLCSSVVRVTDAQFLKGLHLPSGEISWNTTNGTSVAGYWTSFLSTNNVSTPRLSPSGANILTIPYCSTTIASLCFNLQGGV